MVAMTAGLKAKPQYINGGRWPEPDLSARLLTRLLAELGFASTLLGYRPSVQGLCVRRS